VSQVPDSLESSSPSSDPELDEDIGAPALQDDSLAHAAIAGDSEAMQRLWSLHRRWVAAILLAHKPRWADVEDLLQEVALSMVRKLSEVRDARAVRPWLRTVAVNVAHAAARSGKRRAGDERLGEAADDSHQGRGRDFAQPPESLSELEHGRVLLLLAGQLPDGYREPLLLKALQDLSYREIGEILDLPETTIETRIARGRRMLREMASKNTAFSSLD
jgi:RNA polymerase sigma-70 factor (ECF subfamily)